MLTALSVARDCQLIDRQDQVVMVTALPPSESSGARLEYTHSEDHRRTKVCPSSTSAILSKFFSVLRRVIVRNIFIL